MRGRNLMRTCAAIRLAVAAAALVAAGPKARAQDAADPLVEMSTLDALPVETVASASRHAQTAATAPAAITIIGRTQIDAYGWRTLAELLEAVRGVFVTEDRNYAYVAFRGFGRLGDYNSRVLVLVDGHPVNDDVYDAALLGTENVLDLDLVERVEVVRGPASALYGGNAVFGVVNVITRTPASGREGAVTVRGGSAGTAEVSARVGASGPAGEVLAGASAYRSDGFDPVYPELAPPGGDGRVHGLDWDQAVRAFARARRGAFRVSLLASSREKGIPTASWGTAPFDDRNRSRDRRAYLELSWARSFDRVEAFARLSGDAGEYEGWMPYLAEGGTVLNREVDWGLWGTGEARFTWHLPGGHALVWGAEAQSHHRKMSNWDAGGGTWLDARDDDPKFGAYAQAEVQALPAVRAVAGARWDWSGAYGAALSPRGAIVAELHPGTVAKVLLGYAFRPPNTFERLYPLIAGLPPAQLDPEHIYTGEVVLEQALGASARLTAAVYHFRTKGLIDRSTDAETAASTFVNTGQANARGGELEVERRIGRDAAVRASWTIQRSDLSGAPYLESSPMHIAKLHGRAPLGFWRLGAAGEVLYLSSRRTLAGATLPGRAIVNVQLNAPGLLRDRLDLALAVRNALDTAYADPGSTEHLQDALARDGRTVRASATVRF